MEAQKSEKQSSPAAATPPMASCRKKKSEEATFLEDLKEHIDEFVHASMDEHKTCFKKTIQKVLLSFNFYATSSIPQAYVFFIALPIRLYLLLIV